MEILPPQQKLLTTPIQRRHKPILATGEDGYQKYRPCLRWDFAFSCSFCLLHESDFIPGGIKRLPIFTAEHLQLQSECKSKINDYTNIVNSCTWCNNARRTSPINKHGSRLLDPTKDAWGVYFKIENNRITPLLEGSDASYTNETYKLNDDRKVALRERRCKVISTSISRIKQWLEHLEELKVWGENYPAERPKFQTRARQVRQAIYETYIILKEYSPVPHDAPTKCRCKTTEMHCLPSEFLKQLVNIEFA